MIPLISQTLGVLALRQPMSAQPVSAVDTPDAQGFIATLDARDQIAPEQTAPPEQTAQNAELLLAAAMAGVILPLQDVKMIPAKMIVLASNPPEPSIMAQPQAADAPVLPVMTPAPPAASNDEIRLPALPPPALPPVAQVAAANTASAGYAAANPDENPANPAEAAQTALPISTTEHPTSDALPNTSFAADLSAIIPAIATPFVAAATVVKHNSSAKGSVKEEPIPPVTSPIIVPTLPETLQPPTPLQQPAFQQPAEIAAQGAQILPSAEQPRHPQLPFTAAESAWLTRLQIPEPAKSKAAAQSSPALSPPASSPPALIQSALAQLELAQTALAQTAPAQTALTQPDEATSAVTSQSIAEHVDLKQVSQPTLLSAVVQTSATVTQSPAGPQAPTPPLDPIQPAQSATPRQIEKGAPQAAPDSPVAAQTALLQADSSAVQTLPDPPRLHTSPSAMLLGAQQTAQPALASPQTLPAAVPAQLMQHTTAAQSGGVEVLLQPAELGHVKFQMQQQGDTVRVVLTAERAETLDMLRRHADQLLQEFRQAGFSQASLSFGQWGQQQKSTAAPPERPALFDENVAEAAAAPRHPPSPAAAISGQGLNLRL